jgi:8-oxo-dGTP pyrophosphatase MutT (NUDIX family)
MEPVAEALGDVLIDADEATRLELPGQVPSAVLVPLFVAAPPAAQAPEGLHAVFTRRRDDLRRHAGEVSFPGGRRDPSDADLRATAVREAEEEIGLSPGDVTVIGALQPTSTFATNYAIHPFVGVIAPGREWKLSPREVEAVLELSLADLRAGYTRTDVTRRGVTFRTDAYVVGDAFIWGATARILGDLLLRIDALPVARAGQ